MVKLKCILHNKVLCKLIKKYNPVYKYAIIDQFVSSKKYYEYLNEVPEVVKNIQFYTHGEDKCLSVAASSIIARYVFLQKMQELSKQTGYAIPKGAGVNADEMLQKIRKEKGDAYLFNIAKLNFKNYTKLSKHTNLKQSNQG